MKISTKNLLKNRGAKFTDFADYAGLGFNPLQVVSDNPIGYIDNISMLRDIFATIFPDLGDIPAWKIERVVKAELF